MRRLAYACVAIALLFGCGESEADNNDGNNGNTAETCETSGNAVADAIRALPRACESDAECRVVERAGNCECANAINAMADTSEFDAALANLDANMCVHPFAGCGAAQCAYERGYRDPVLVAQCVESECVVAEAMSCAEFEQNIYGGLVAASRCETANDCTLRNDLNPCGCQEGVGTDFPFLAAESIYNLIGINRDRCDFTCEACPAVTEAACVQNVCVAQ